MGVAKKNANLLAKNYPKLALVVTREPAVQRCKHKQVAFVVSSHGDTNKNFVAAQIIEFLAQNTNFFDPKGLIGTIGARIWLITGSLIS